MNEHRNHRSSTAPCALPQSNQVLRIPYRINGSNTAPSLLPVPITTEIWSDHLDEC